MAKYAIGNVIYENRIRKKITQEELGCGICTAVTLSRIENGVQMPRRKTFEALMQRLGLYKQYYFLPITNEEMERSNLEYEITRKLSLKEYDIKELLVQYKNCSSEMDHMEEQFYIYASALMLKNNKSDIEKMTELLLKAITLTIPNFSLKSLNRSRFLTFDEITIINNIAINYHYLDKQEDAKKLLIYLKDYLEHKDVDMEEKAKVYPMILFNLSNWLGAEGRNELVYELCNTGIDFCIKYGKLTLFPNLIFNKGYSLARMNRLDEAAPLFCQACTFFEALKDVKQAERCRKEVYNTFSIKI